MSWNVLVKLVNCSEDLVFLWKFSLVEVWLAMVGQEVTLDLPVFVLRDPSFPMYSSKVNSSFKKLSFDFGALLNQNSMNRSTDI